MSTKSCRWQVLYNSTWPTWADTWPFTHPQLWCANVPVIKQIRYILVYDVNGKIDGSKHCEVHRGVTLKQSEREADKDASVTVHADTLLLWLTSNKCRRNWSSAGLAQLMFYYEN